jgi:hypothetical protein
MIKFENERSFEDMLFDHIRMTMVDPVYEDVVVYGQRQPDFGKNGIGDILLVTEREPFKGDINIRSLHLIELKVQPLIASHIAQICKYKGFLEDHDFQERVNVQECRYTLISPYSEISPELFYLASSSNVEIRYYEISMSGIKFSEYESDVYDDQTEKAADALSSKINGGMK